jgi:hypothetical protein
LGNNVNSGSQAFRIALFEALNPEVSSLHPSLFQKFRFENLQYILQKTNITGDQIFLFKIIIAEKHAKK